MFSNFRRLVDLARCFNRIRPHLRGGKWLFLAVLGSSLLMTLFEGVGVGMLVPLLSLLMGGESSSPMRPIQWLQSFFPGRPSGFYVGAFAGIIVLSIFLKNVASFVSSRLSSRFKHRVLGNLRESLFKRLHSSELEVFEQRTAGEISNVFFHDTIRTTLAFEAGLSLSQRLSMGLVYLASLFYISWTLTVFVSLLAIAIGVSISWVMRRLSSLGTELGEANRLLAKAVGESFAGVRLVRATNSNARELDRFQQLNQHQLDVEDRSSKNHALMHPIAETVAVVGAMSLVAAAYILYVKPGLMLSSHLFGYCFILLRVIPLVNQIYLMQGHLLYMASGVEDVERWLSLVQQPEKPFGKTPFQGITRSIEFRNVGFRYPSGTEALRCVSFSIPANRKVALVGASGSGKSTIAALLLRLRPPSSGEIRVDGTDFWEFTPESWHKSVALVDQDTFLFQDTIGYNIGYGADAPDEKAIQAAVDAANLREFVDSLPQGINTMVGDRGVQLSGGQRQRVAIARAIVRSPQFLILDEATSSLDTMSERHVQEAIDNVAISRTVLIIAHRLSTVRNADRIVVLGRGTVVEEGTWADLMSTRGALYLLVNAGDLSDKAAISGPVAQSVAAL